MSSTGPSTRAVVRVINQNSCGSGSICGHWEGGSLALTNAHVAGTEIGREVIVEIESLNMRRWPATVIRAAFSSSVSADWALLHIPGIQEIEPVYLTKTPPKTGESMYTKGFPQCRKHNGTDIEQVVAMTNGVLLWRPDAIGGQSGSGVWGDADGLQKALLTWSIKRGNKWYGAGQLTSEIYRQNRSLIRGDQLRGSPRLPGLKELDDFDFIGVNRDGATDPVVQEGFHSAPIVRGIQDYPIWFEDLEPVDPSAPPSSDGNDCHDRALAAMYRVRESIEDEIKQFESPCNLVDPDDDQLIDETFGL